MHERGGIVSGMNMYILRLPPKRVSGAKSEGGATRAPEGRRF